jgi:hypothetical protein
LRLQSLPRCRAAPGARARGAAVLRWCSPQSSVPRQTVGHHARAAMYEMGLTAACEGHRGEVPRQCLDIPPAGALLLPSHIPTGRGAVGRTARRAEGWISQSRKTHFGAFCKKWARELAAAHLRATDPAESAGFQQCRAGPRDQPVYQYCCSQAPAAALLLPSHIPTGRGAVFRTARRAEGWISQSRKTHLGAFCKKWARELARPGNAARGGPGHGQAPAGPGQGGLPCTVYPVPPAIPPSRLPCTAHPPTKPSTLYRPGAYQPVYPAPPASPPSRLPYTARMPTNPSTLYRPPAHQAVYPVPPRCLPTRLPCTARQPTKPSTLYRPLS